jgi:hypothetical protein
MGLSDASGVASRVPPPRKVELVDAVSSAASVRPEPPPMNGLSAVDALAESGSVRLPPPMYTLCSGAGSGATGSPWQAASAATSAMEKTWIRMGHLDESLENARAVRARAAFKLTRVTRSRKKSGMDLSIGGVDDAAYVTEPPVANVWKVAHGTPPVAVASSPPDSLCFGGCFCSRGADTDALHRGIFLKTFRREGCCSTFVSSPPPGSVSRVFRVPKRTQSSSSRTGSSLRESRKGGMAGGFSGAAARHTSAFAPPFLIEL